MKKLDDKQDPTRIEGKTKVAWKALTDVSRKFNFSESEMLILLGNMPAEYYQEGVATSALP